MNKKARRVGLLAGLAAGAVGLVASAPILARIDYAELPRRASWQRPGQVIEALSLRPGDHVADIGAGDGYFTFLLADAVGPEGRVYAVDVDEGVVEELRRTVSERGARNVEVILAPADDPTLPDGAIDLAFVCNVYHHIEDPIPYFERLRADLQDDGRIAIVEIRSVRPIRWLTPRGHWTSREKLHQELAAAGYRSRASFDFLPLQSFEVFSPNR